MVRNVTNIYLEIYELCIDLLSRSNMGSNQWPANTSDSSWSTESLTYRSNEKTKTAGCDAIWSQQLCNILLLWLHFFLYCLFLTSILHNENSQQCWRWWFKCHFLSKTIVLLSQTAGGECDSDEVFVCDQ